MTQRFQDYATCRTKLRDNTFDQALYDAGAVIMADVLLTLKGDEHQKRRRLEMRVFGRSFFKYYETEVFPKTLAETLAPMAAGGAMDLMEFGYRVTINLTADFAGIDRPERTAEETESLLAMVKTFSEGATMIHSTRPKEDVEAEVLAALRAFDERFLQPSRARRQALLQQFEAGEISEDALPRDILTVLLRNQDKVDLPSDVLLREMGFYMQAGAHSTANAMVHSLHEIFAWAGDDAARWDQVMQDKGFVQLCVHESLRLHPASPEALRKRCPVASNDTETIALDLYSANRDTAIFGDDAETFKPGRERPKGVPPAGLTFGTGVHACLGQELDGGVIAKPGTPDEERQLGIVTLLVIALLERGARPDSAQAPTSAVNTSRPNWGHYPVVFAA